MARHSTTERQLLFLAALLIGFVREGRGDLLAAPDPAAEVAARVGGLPSGAPALAELDRGQGGSARFALAYEDQIWLYLTHHPATQVQVVGTVFTQYLHTLVRNPVQVHHPEDYLRLRIWMGDRASRHLAELYFDQIGMPLAGLKVVSSSRERFDGQARRELFRRFDEGKSDVALIAAPPGAAGLCAEMATGMYVLLPLDSETRRLLIGAPGSLRVGEIPAGTYSSQPEVVPTVSRSLLLVARQGESPESARRKLADARAAWRALPQAAIGCPAVGSPPAVHPSAGADLPWLAGMQAPGLPGPTFWATLSAALLLGLGAWAWKRGLAVELRRFWNQDKLPFLLLLGLSLSILTITIATHLFEKNVNDKFATIPESFWSITIYLFSGLEDRTPYTFPGRFVATLGLLLGPAFFAVMSGWLARYFIRRDKRMPQNLRDHFLLLNWNERAVTVVREIHHPILVANDGPSVIVLLTDRADLSLQQLKESGSGRDEAFEDFYLSIGDPTSERGLLNANAQDARTVVIFAEEGHGDERTFRSIFALRRIARERGITNLHVVAELLDPANVTILDEMARDFPGLLERVSNTEVRTLLMAQAAMTPGIVRFYTDLLRTTDDTNELYSLRIPDEATGMAFGDYAARVFQAELPEPLVPVGIQRIVDGRPFLLTNPRPEDPASVLQLGDRLLVFAYGPPTPGILPVPIPIPAVADLPAAGG